MAKITIHENGQKLEEIAIRPGTMTIGRGPGNHVQIRNAGVSTDHARIVTLMDLSYVEDLGSTNGTFVNDKRVQRHTLHNGDVIRIGNRMLVFSAEAGAATQPQQNLDHTQVLNRKDIEALLSGAEKSSMPQTSPKTMAALQAIAESPRPKVRDRDIASQASASMLVAQESTVSSETAIQPLPRAPAPTQSAPPAAAAQDRSPFPLGGSAGTADSYERFDTASSTTDSGQRKVPLLGWVLAGLMITIIVAFTVWMRG